MLRDGLQGSFGLPGGDTWTHSREESRVQEAPVIEIVFYETGKDLAVHTGGNPDDFRRAESEGALETTRRHANHGIGRRVQSNRLPDDIGIRTEFVAPQGKAQHGHIVSADLFVFVGKEETAAARLNPQDVEVVSADEQTVELFRFRATAPGKRRTE